MVLQKRIAKEEIQMQISLLLMQQIAQLFLILLMGYAVVKTGLLKASDSKVRLWSLSIWSCPVSF